MQGYYKSSKDFSCRRKIAPVIEIHEEHPQSLVLLQTRVEFNVAVL